MHRFNYAAECEQYYCRLFVHASSMSNLDSRKILIPDEMLQPMASISEAAANFVQASSNLPHFFQHLRNCFCGKPPLLLH